MEGKKKVTFSMLLNSMIEALRESGNFIQADFNRQYFDVADSTFRKWKTDNHFPSFGKVVCIDAFQKIASDIFRGACGDRQTFGRMIKKLKEQDADLPKSCAERAADDSEAAAEFLKILITEIYRDHERQVIENAQKLRETETGAAGNSFGRREDTGFLKEDADKLTQRYGFLTKQMYQSDRFVRYENRIRPDGSRRDAEKSDAGQTREDGAFVFPVLCDARLRERRILVRDEPEKMYEPPAFVREHEEELHQAHAGSFVYNNLNIRVDDWKEKDDTFEMHTSRTKYFYSLLTNRAMDYRLRGGRTVRDELYDGPFPKDLSESLLSNHLGFNGFLITADDFVPLVKRRTDVSVEKGFYGDSIQASLKTRYALADAKTPLTLSGIENAVRMEIRDELKIPEEEIRELKFLYAYRNLVEGGKPQLLFSARCTGTKESVQERFERLYAGREGDINVDAAENDDRFLWIPLSDLRAENVFIMPEGIIYKGKRYPMVPSASAAVVMLISYLKENGK